MSRIFDAPIVAGMDVGRPAVSKPTAFKAKLLVTTMLLAAALSLSAATSSSAQSYDPDLGSGNIARSYGGMRHFGRINPAWHASVFHRRHVRHHHAR
jgi:hypothetical protein